MARQRHLWHVYIWVCTAFFLLNYVTRLSNRILSLYLHLLFSFFFFIASLLAVLTLRTETDLHIFFEKSTKSLFHFSNGSLYGSRGAT